MGQIQLVIDRLNEEREDNAAPHQQTLKISEYDHQRLTALAQHYGVTKTWLASRLLDAAISDAFDRLPADAKRTLAPNYTPTARSRIERAIGDVPPVPWDRDKQVGDTGS